MGLIEDVEALPEGPQDDNDSDSVESNESASRNQKPSTVFVKKCDAVS
jgi:hypothetical protein